MPNFCHEFGLGDFGEACGRVVTSPRPRMPGASKLRSQKSAASRQLRATADEATALLSQIEREREPKPGSAPKAAAPPHPTTAEVAPGRSGAANGHKPNSAGSSTCASSSSAAAQRPKGAPARRAAEPASEVSSEAKAAVDPELLALMEAAKQRQAEYLEQVGARYWERKLHDRACASRSTPAR